MNTLCAQKDGPHAKGVRMPISHWEKVMRPRAVDNLAKYKRRSKNDRNRHVGCTPGGAQGERARV